MKTSLFSTVLLGALLCTTAAGRAQESTADTGISGVYEAMVAVEDGDYALRYFAEFGFRVVAEARVARTDAEDIYAVPSALTSYRLQNGDIDSHGLLRVLVWDEPLGPGVGYAPPETVGTRMAVMRSGDIMRLADVFEDWRAQGETPLLLAGPVYDDLYDATEGTPDLFNRRVGVREMAIYGQWFNHVFFQRYGYTIPGYGTIGDEAPLRTSEFTHHDFVVAGDLDEVTAYYTTVFGMQAENEHAVIDGDWQAGPREVFQMTPGRSHWYRGFVSPNNICGKLKFFSLHGLHSADDRSARQRPGELGITLHSLWTPRLTLVHDRALRAGLEPTPIRDNEFGERSFVLTGPDGVTWQLIERATARRAPVTDFELVPVAQ
jgi:catechol 2,3-dioxygenase-like lactoylglutathione lyase family enzyme